MEHKIKIYKEGKLVRETVGNTGDTLLDVVSATGEFLDAPCGGQGKCGKCLVSLTPGGEMVKACTTKVDGDMDVYLPDQKMWSLINTALQGEPSHPARLSGAAHKMYSPSSTTT